MPVKKRSRLRKSRRQVYKMEFVHKSVLFAETVGSHAATPGKWLVDGTAGGGGHARAIAESGCHLLAVDQDPDAIAVLHRRLDDLPNVTIVHDNFANIKNILIDRGLSGHRWYAVGSGSQLFSAGYGGAGLLLPSRRAAGYAYE